MTGMFLQLRTCIQAHPAPRSIFLTPGLDTQAIFAKLFADISIEDVRYAKIDALLEDGPPPPTAVTSWHVQALQADLRAETLFHAAGPTLPSMCMASLAS